MKKWISIGVLVLLVVGGGIWFYQSKQTTTTAAAEVVTTTVQRGDIEVNITGSGSVASANSVDVASTVSGEVDEVLVTEDQVVAVGDELITFTDGSDPVTATVAGTVSSISVVSGDHVQTGGVVAHITDYTNLQTVITVDELDVSSVVAGQTAEITASAFPEETFAGTVTKVAKEGTAESGVSSFEVTISITDPKQLLIGMTTEVSITTESKTGVLYVPIEAVKVDGEEKYVTLQESTDADAATTKQVVETGINDDQYIEIVSGLEEGQTIQQSVTISSGSDDSSSSDRGQMSGGFPSGDMGGTPPSDAMRMQRSE